MEIDETACGSTILEEMLDRLGAEGRRPKFVYTVPTFQNPAGVTMSAERRLRLVEVARERELLVVEDNPYGLLRYEGEPNEPLSSSTAATTSSTSERSRRSSPPGSGSAGSAPRRR